MSAQTQTSCSAQLNVGAMLVLYLPLFTLFTFQKLPDSPVTPRSEEVDCLQWGQTTWKIYHFKISVFFIAKTAQLLTYLDNKGIKH